MRALTNVSIRRKLTLLGVTTSVLALLLACAAFVLHDAATFQRKLELDLHALADVIGSNSTAALTFDDPAAAREALSALQAEKHVVSACIYGKDGAPFAAYVRGGSEQVLWPPTAQLAGAQTT